jgi:hypothetical protein
VGAREVLWLGERGGGEGPGGPGGVFLEKDQRERERCYCNNFQSARFGIDVALLLPNTRGQKERGDATVKLGQRGVNVLKWSKLGFSGDPI